MFASLRSLVQGQRTSTRSIKLKKSQSCSRLPVSQASGGDGGRGRRKKDTKAARLESKGEGDEDNGDGSPASQSSFFSGGTGEASSSDASTPATPDVLSPSLPLRSPSLSNRGNSSKESWNDRARCERAGMPTTNPASGENGRNNGGDGVDECNENGSGIDQQPPSYDSLFTSSQRAGPGDEDGTYFHNKGSRSRHDDGAKTRGDGGNRVNFAHFNGIGKPRDQPYILKKQRSGKRDASRERSHNKARSRSSSSDRGLGVTSAGSGGTVPHMPPAERTALRAFGEDGDIGSAQEREQDGEYPPQQDQLSNSGGDGAVAEATAQEAPRKHKGVSDMERAYIRSLAETDPEVMADNELLGPLLAHVPRARLYGSVPAPFGGGDSIGLDGVSTKKVAMGYKKTLVLDLDETLVSSSRTPCDCDYKIVFKIHGRVKRSIYCEGVANDGMVDAGSNSGKGYEELHYFVRLRPGLATFLKRVANIYELVIWTASGKSYADAIMDLLDPTGTLFAARLYRDSCLRHHNLCVKDLRRLGRPMNTVVLLDNHVYSFGLTLDNGVPISPWNGAQDAKESGLSAAFFLLRSVARFPDVRKPLVTAFDMHLKIHGNRSAAFTAPAGDASTTASGGISAAASTSQRRRRNRFHNPLSPVASLASLPSSPSSADAASSCPSPASTRSPGDGFTARGGAGAQSSRRRGVGGSALLSPVAAVWAATAASKEEQERIAAEHALLEAKSLRSVAGDKPGRPRRPRQQQQQQQQQNQQQQRRQGSCGKQASDPMRSKLARQESEAQDIERALQQGSGQELQQQQQQVVPQRLQGGAAAEALRTLKRGVSCEDATKLSPVVARWAAKAAARAEIEAEATREMVAAGLRSEETVR